MGTAGYMSPEQVRGETLDARADLFSLGLVLYEMATGRRTFSGETAAILHDAILNQTPVPVMELNPDVPAKLASAITKALEKDRERRYPSASEMRADLAEVRTARGTWLRPLSRGLGTAALLVVVAASAWLYQRARGQITLTNQDTIVLADFTNHTSDLVFGDALNTALRTEMEQTVKGGVKTDHWGGVKVDQWVGRRSGIVGEEGVWSGGLRRLKGGAFRPERKTSSSPSVFTAVGVGGRRIRSSAVSLACACSASGGSSRRSSPECGRGG